MDRAYALHISRKEMQKDQGAVNTITGLFKTHSAAANTLVAGLSRVKPTTHLNPTIPGSPSVQYQILMKYYLSGGKTRNLIHTIISAEYGYYNYSTSRS